MKIAPLPKEFRDRAVKGGIKYIAIHLCWEGRLDVDVTCNPHRFDDQERELEKALRTWANRAYKDYQEANSTAPRFGCEIHYNLVGETMQYQEWFVMEHWESPVRKKLEIAE